MPQISDAPAAGMLAYGWYMYTSYWSLKLVRDLRIHIYLIASRVYTALQTQHSMSQYGSNVHHLLLHDTSSLVECHWNGCSGAGQGAVVHGSYGKRHAALAREVPIHVG